MSYRKTPYRDKDKRSLLLEKESEKLRREISELEDALILHSRYEKDHDESVRGLIRKEIGGSHWEHGGDGKLHSYRSHKDLQDESNVKRKCKETHRKKGTRQHETRSQNCQELAQRWKSQKPHTRTSPTKQSPSLKQEEISHKKSTPMDLEISSMKAEWKSPHWEEYSNTESNFHVSKDSEKIVNAQEGNSMKDMKSKASAKISKNSNTKKDNSSQKKMLPGPKEGSKIRKTFSNNGQHTNTKDRDSEGERSEDLLKLAKIQDSLSKLNEKPSSKQHELLSFEKPLLQAEKFAIGGRTHFIDSPRQEECGKNKFVTNKNYIPAKLPVKELFPWSPVETNPQLDSNTSNRQPEKVMSNKQEERIGDNTQKTNIPDQSKMECPQLDDEVCLWLQNLGLQSTEYYKELFAYHEMDMASIRLLTSTQLREMGIHALGPIMKIIKGVQILGRRNSRDDSKSSETCIQKDIHTEKYKPSHIDKTIQPALVCNTENMHNDLQPGWKGHDPSDSVKQQEKEMPSAEKKHLRGQESECFNNAPKKEKILQLNEAKWKETFDEAEFLNLHDRSPTADLETPLLVAVKETDSYIKHQTSPKIAKQTRKAGIKSKKPPATSRVMDDGILRAAQRVSEKCKQQHDLENTEGRSRARRKELRDEMAARHHIRRRSVSMDRDTPSLSPKPLLERSSSFNTKKDINQLQLSSSKKSPQHIDNKEIVSAKIKDKSPKNDTEAGDRQHMEEIKINEIVSVLRDIPGENLKTPTENNLSTLGVVRELKKQLSNLEQHLVHSQDDKQRITKDHTDKTISPKSSKMSKHETLALSGHNITEMNNTFSNVSKEDTMPLSGRKSARERRREKLDLDLRDNISAMGSVNELPAASHGKYQAESATTNPVTQYTSHSNMRQSKTVLTVDENLKPTTPMSVKTLHDLDKTEAQELKHETDSKEINNCKPKLADNKSEEDLQNSSLPLKTQSMPKVSKSKGTGAQESLKKIEIQSQDITFEKRDILGEGIFSQVFKGTYQGSHVAVKVLRAPLLSADRNYFAAEVSLLKELRHPHVVMLLGVCTLTTQPIMVLELMEGGNLFAHLHDQTLPHLLKEDFYQIAHDVASGVSYLHHHRPPVLHLDLKSKNILLGYGNRAKVADFGFSKLKHEADTKISRASKPSALFRSPAWMAPELLTAGEITAKADVYSFAIVLWEMMTREHPYDGFSMFQVLEHLRLNRRPVLPSGYPQELTQLITKCWEQNPAARPSFKNILKSLDKSTSSIEWISWPDNQVYGEHEEKTLDKTLPKEMVDKVSIETDKHHAGKEEDESFYSVNNNSMDVRSVSSEDFDSLHSDDGEMVKKFSNLSKKDNIEQIVTEKDLVLNISPHGDSDHKITNLLNNSPQPKTKRSVEINSNVNVSHSHPPIAKKLSKSPVLVPSPRIQEMARKQAVERGSSTLLSHSIDHQNETGRESSQSLRAAAYQNEDAELETLIHKYLPSPRNKTLIKQIQLNTNHSLDVTDKLLPRRQSLSNKPKKPPKPSKMQTKPMPFQSLNLDRLSSLSQSLSQPWENEHQPSDQKSINMQLSHKKDKEDRVEDENLGEYQHLKNEISKNLTSFKFHSSDFKNSPREENSIQSSHLQGALSQDISSSKILVENKYNDETKSNEHIKISQSLNPQMSSTTSPPKKNIREVHPQVNSEEINYGGLSSWFDSPEIKSPIYELQQSTEISLIAKENPIQKTKSHVEEKENVLPANEESGADTLSCEDETFHSHNVKRQDHDVSKSSLSCQNDPIIHSNRQMSPKQEKNQSLPLCNNSVQLDLSDDGDSSTYSDFSADSLSLRWSDVDSVDSIEDKSTPRKVKNSHRLKTKEKRKSVKDKYNIEHVDKNVTSLSRTIDSQEAKPDGNVRESFFLFDDFQRIPNITHTILPNYIEDISRTLPTDSKTINSNINIVGTKLNSPKAKSFQLQQADLINGKLNLKKIKSNSQTASKQKSPSHERQNSKKVDNTEDVSCERLGQPKWSDPHISNDGPELRQPRNIQFSLNANMLVKQKRQLKSVAVQGDSESSLNEMKKGVKGSLPSFANILKKAIEERRLALGDHIESQDMTPEASWSLQDD